MQLFASIPKFSLMVDQMIPLKTIAFYWSERV
jgi:hypothetical protein